MLLRSQYTLEVFNAATVSWLAQAKKLHTQDFVLTLGGSTLGGAFREILFGLIFFKPFHRLAEGKVNEAITGRITYHGNPDSFTKSACEKITESTSANLQFAEDSTTDKVVDALKQLPEFELISSILPKEQVELLQQTFTSPIKQTNRGYNR
jgi:uncharacterized membrane protein